MCLTAHGGAEHEGKSHECPDHRSHVSLICYAGRFEKRIPNANSSVTQMRSLDEVAGDRTRIFTRRARTDRGVGSPVRRLRSARWPNAAVEQRTADSSTVAKSHVKIHFSSPRRVLCAEEFWVDPLSCLHTIGAKPGIGSVTVSERVPRKITVRPHFCAVAKL